MTLYDTDHYNCTFSAAGSFTVKEHPKWSEIDTGKGSKAFTFTLDLSGSKWRILWPNREGEMFPLSAAAEIIKKHDVQEGLTLSYPATASCRTLIFLEETNRGFAFLSPPDRQGRVTEFRLLAEKRERIRIIVTGYPDSWYRVPFHSLTELGSTLKTLRQSVEWKLLDFVETNSRWQVQIGLIGPDGRTKVPEDRGFSILADISEVMLHELGEQNILHTFGYAMGHDRGYPNYTPSSLLGGKKKLEQAITDIHRNRQKAVFYMNGRISQKDQVNKQGLRESVLRDPEGNPFSEIYQGREFLVMDPSSQKWQEKLYTEAMQLKELGADGIQLDQLGGRAALVSPGEIWGKGYRSLIDKMRNKELTVWIQGLSDIYPANWFELTYRGTSILNDGTIRGGTPLGIPDRRLFELSVPGQVLLIPLSKTERNREIPSKKIITDLNKSGGDLFLYTSLYIEQLQKIIVEAVAIMGNSAENRVAAGITNK